MIALNKSDKSRVVYLVNNQYSGYSSGLSTTDAIYKPVRCLIGILTEDQVRARIELLTRAIDQSTNGYQLSLYHQHHRSICEWDPSYNRLSRTGDQFHAYATRHIGKGVRRLRVCAGCARMSSVRLYSRDLSYEIFNRPSRRY